MKLRIGQINIKKYAWVALIAVVLIALVVAFLYYDRTNAISLIIQRLGFSGAILAILLISVLCMTPIPSEGLVVLFLKVYGVYWGTIFAWIGS
ncbi:MAG TPA: TVP38/TMEM64 family protein, partial [Desulfobacteria bacterium]|nr:TVP38/TMEM64 family protein [Desulfobacteria bacterium]